MATKKSSKRAVKSTAKSDGAKWTLAEFLVGYLKMFLARNTEIALSAGALPTPLDKRSRENWRHNGSDKCGMIKGNKRCGGNLVPLDTPHGKSLEVHICDRCMERIVVAYLWTNQKFAGSVDGSGNRMAKVSSKLDDLLAVNPPLVDMPECLRGLERGKRWVPVVQYATGEDPASPWHDDPSKAPLQQRRIAGGFSIGLTEQVLRSGKAKSGKTGAAPVSRDALIAELDF